jgi:hypothetical protein
LIYSISSKQKKNGIVRFSVLHLMNAIRLFIIFMKEELESLNSFLEETIRYEDFLNEVTLLNNSDILFIIIIKYLFLNTMEITFKMSE